MARKGGLSAKTFKGLSSKRMASKGGSANMGKRLVLKQGDTVPVQFLQNPEDMREFDIHVFQEDGKWNYVPCLEKNCPLCDDEDSKKSKVTYRFIANVYNLKEKKVQLVEGPRDLASRIFYRYERKPANFLKRTFEITKFNTQPVTYDVSLGEDSPVKTTTLELFDLDDYIDEEARRYFGDDVNIGKSSLDADDDDDDDTDEDADEVDEDELREELEELTDKQLKARAKANGAKLADYKTLDTDELIDLVVSQEAGPVTEEDDDEDDEDEDDDLDTEDEDLDDDDEDEEDEDEDDEDDDEDDPPFEPSNKAPARKGTAKRPAKKAAAAAKKTPAKKSASRRS